MYLKKEEEFIECLLEKKDVYDCYKKIFELKNDIENEGGDIFNLLWKVYIYFYATTNPKMEKFIMKKEIEYKNLSENENEKKQLQIMYVVKNMFISKYTKHVFDITRSNKNKTCLYLLKNKNTIKNKYFDLIHSIKKKHYNNTLFELKKHILNYDDDDDEEKYTKRILEIYNEIINHFEKVYGSCDREKIMNAWKTRPNLPICILPDYLLAIIIHLYEDETNIRNQTIFVTPRSEEIEFVKKINI